MNEPFNEKTIHSLLCNQDVKSLLSNYLKQGQTFEDQVVEEMTRVDATRKMRLHMNPYHLMRDLMGTFSQHERASITNSISFI